MAGRERRPPVAQLHKDGTPLYAWDATCPRCGWSQTCGGTMWAAIEALNQHCRESPGCY
jgi:hypothetical protein